MARIPSGRLDESSWIDVAEDEDKMDDSLSSSRTALSSSRHIANPPSKTGRRARKLRSPRGSTLIMPKIEDEIPPAKIRTGITTPYMEQSVASIKPSTKVKRRKKTLADHAGHASNSILDWLIEIVLGGLQVIKTPLKYAFGLWLLTGLLVISSNALTTRISNAISPICRIPGSSIVFPSFCESSVNLQYSAESAPEPEFDHLMNIQQKFEDLLHQSVEHYAVPTFLKHSQSAMRDVREVVRYSPLKSKRELLFEFDNFVSAASQASWDLETFNSHIGRTVDKIMTTAKWTQRTLQEISDVNSTRGPIEKVFNLIMYPFQPVKLNEDRVLDLYLQHADEVQQQIADLLTEAQSVFALLKSLEDTVDSIHGITVKDKQIAEAGRDEILAQLWTQLGGNRTQRKMFESQLKILQQVSAYGQSAYTSVAGAILRLQTMSSEIDQLKERLMSVERVPGKTKVPLSVHLENIQMGVERLEEARGYARDQRVAKARAVIGKGRDLYGDILDAPVPTRRKELPKR
jgi:hypothetical protein